MTTLDWWRGAPYGWCCGSSSHAESVKPQRVRRRNRARHVEIGRGEITDATATPHVELPGGDGASTNEVWRAECENEAALGSINFDGRYSVG